jgi:hypothetical protein
MPVQINEQNLTIYNLIIGNLSADDAHKHVSKFFLLCYTVSKNIDRLLLRKMCMPDSSMTSIIASASNWFTNIHFFVGFETEEIEQIQMAILAILYH